MIKQWICSIDGGLTYYIVGANHKPVGALLDAPIDAMTGDLEDIAWLVIQDSTDGDGNPIKIAVVDTAMKTTLVKAKKDKDKADKDSKKIKDDALIAALAYVESFDKTTLAGITEVQDAMEQLAIAIKLIINN